MDMSVAATVDSSRYLAGTDARVCAVISGEMKRQLGWISAAGLLLTAGCTDGGQFLPTQIVFTSDRAGSEQVYIMKANGDDVRQLSAGEPAKDASMSAAGTKIVYTKLQNGVLRIYVNNHEGTNEQIRFDGITRDHQHSPKYNKNGSRLVFVTGQGESQEIWRIDSNGNDVRQLTESPGADFSPNWTSGTDVVYVSNRTGNNEIFIMEGDGLDQVRLTDDGGDDVFPACKPFGNGIVFSSNRTGSYQLYTMDFDGQNLVQLTTSAGNKYGASYSLDGDKIFFYGDANGNMEVYSVNADGTGEVNLTNNAAADTKVGTWVAP
jgi:Tol biopolymer transport system component